MHTRPVNRTPARPVSENATRTSLNLSVTAGSRVVEIGTSLTDNGFRDHSEADTIRGYGSRGVMNYVRLQTNQSFEYYNVGIGGNTIDDMINRFDHDVVPLEPDFIFIDAGTNDSTKSFAEYVAKLTELYNMAEQTAKKGVMRYLIPYRGLPTSDAVNTLYYQVNEWIKSTYPNKYIDTNKYFANLDTKRPLGNFTVDGIHFSNVGAYQISRSVLEAIEFESGNITGTALTTNPSLSGSGGTQDSLVSGTMPDGYHMDILSGMATMAVDTTQGHLRAIITPNMGASTFRIRGDNFTAGQAGKLYEFISSFKLSDWDGWDYFHLRLKRNGSRVEPSSYDLRQEASGFEWATDAFSDFRIAKTQDLYQTADTVSFTPYIEFGIKDTAIGNGEFEVNNWQVQEYTPPIFDDVALTLPDIEVGFRASAAEILYNTGTEIHTLYGKHGTGFVYTSTSHYTNYDANALDGVGGVVTAGQAQRLMANANIPSHGIAYGVFDLNPANGSTNYDTFGFGTTSTSDFTSAVNKILQGNGENRWYSGEGNTGNETITSDDYRGQKIAIIAEFKNGVISNYYINDGDTPVGTNIDIFDGYIDRARFIMGGGNHAVGELMLSHRTFDEMHITPQQLMNSMKSRYSIT